MAYSALVERTVKLSPAQVYAYLIDFGGIGKLLPDDVDSVTMRGEGIGGVRLVRLKGASGDLEERLEATVENRLLSYSLIKNTVLPVDLYHAVVELQDAPGGGCKIRWGSNWVAKGASEAEARPMLEGIYTKLIDAMVKAG